MRSNTTKMPPTVSFQTSQKSPGSVEKQEGWKCIDAQWIFGMSHLNFCTISSNFGCFQSNLFFREAKCSIWKIPQMTQPLPGCFERWFFSSPSKMGRCPQKTTHLQMQSCQPFHVAFGVESSLTWMLCFGPILGIGIGFPLRNQTTNQRTFFWEWPNPNQERERTWIGGGWWNFCAQESWERSINLPRFLCHSDDSWRWWRKRTSDLGPVSEGRFLYNGPSHFFSRAIFVVFCQMIFFSTLKQNVTLTPLSSLTWNWKIPMFNRK